MPSPLPVHDSPAGTFAAALCGLDGSLESIEAARQASVLCGPGTRLRLATIAPAPANGNAARRMLERGASCDLLAVGAGNPAAAALLQAAPVSVLVARRPPAGGFGESVLVAVDDGPSCMAAAEVAAAVAARRHSRIAVVAAPGHDDGTRQVLARVLERLRAVDGSDPVVLDENVPAHRAVAAAAAMVEATLVVTGSRGPGAPDSVSLRIAEAAPCSVLVVRSPGCG
jgi:nucleotide-binding universal stress UspA family protein